VDLLRARRLALSGAPRLRALALAALLALAPACAAAAAGLPHHPLEEQALSEPDGVLRQLPALIADARARAIPRAGAAVPGAGQCLPRGRRLALPAPSPAPPRAMPREAAKSRCCWCAR
jgi:hypothetical protein